MLNLCSGRRITHPFCIWQLEIKIHINVSVKMKLALKKDIYQLETMGKI